MQVLLSDKILIVYSIHVICIFIYKYRNVFFNIIIKVKTPF